MSLLLKEVNLLSEDNIKELYDRSECKRCERLIQIMVIMACIDGNFAQSEFNKLMEIVENNKVSYFNNILKEEIAAIVLRTKRDIDEGKLIQLITKIINSFSGYEEKVRIYAFVSMIASADKELHYQEKSLLNTLKNEWNIDDNTENRIKDFSGADAFINEGSRSVLIQVDFLMIMIIAMIIDKKISEIEKKEILELITHQYAKYFSDFHNVDELHIVIDGIINYLNNKNSKDIQEIISLINDDLKNKRDKKDALYMMMRICASDGIIEKEELELINKTSKIFGLEISELEDSLKIMTDASKERLDKFQ